MSYDPLADLSAAVKTNTTGQSGRRARAQAEHGAGAIVQAASRDGVAGNFMVLQRLRKSMRRILTFAAGFRLLIRHLSCSELLLEAGDSDSHYSFTFRLPGQRTVRLPCGSRGADLLFVAQAYCHPSACSCLCHVIVASVISSRHVAALRHHPKVRGCSRARELQPLACAHIHVGNDDNCYNPCVLRASQAFADRINISFSLI